MEAALVPNPLGGCNLVVVNLTGSGLSLPRT